MASCGVGMLLLAGTVHAAPRTEVRLNEAAYPEGITSTPNGTVIFGSYTKPIIYRAGPRDIVAVPWIRLEENGAAAASLGVLADSVSNTLWVCVAHRKQGEAGRSLTTSFLQSFNLRTGKRTASYKLPSERALCNDITIGPNRSVFATDTIGGRILKLNRKTRALDVWLEDKKLNGADGIAFLGSRLYVNSFFSGHIYRIPIGSDGKAEAPVDIKLSQPVVRPDCMRAHGERLFLVENHPSNKISMLRFKGDEATVTILKENIGTPASITLIGDHLWIDESKMAYLHDPMLKGQDPGQMRAFSIPLPR